MGKARQACLGVMPEIRTTVATSQRGVQSGRAAERPAVAPAAYPAGSVQELAAVDVQGLPGDL